LAGTLDDDDLVGETGKALQNALQKRDTEQHFARFVSAKTPATAAGQDDRGKVRSGRFVAVCFMCSGQAPMRSATVDVEPVGRVNPKSSSRLAQLNGD
jgi:hypothetical protein